MEVFVESDGHSQSALYTNTKEKKVSYSPPLPKQSQKQNHRLSPNFRHTLVLQF